MILRYCATSGRAWWGWTAWDWAAVCGPSSQAFRAAQPLPTETTVRPFTIALGYLLGEFSDFQHLGNFNRLQLAQLVFSAADRGGDEAGQRGDGPLGLPQPDPRRWPLPATRHPRPGPADQPQPRLEDLGTAAFVALRAHPATSGRHPGALHALQRWSPTSATATRRCGPASTTLPASSAPTRAGPRGSSAGMTPPPSPPRSAPGPDPDGQGRTVAGRRAPRDHRTGPVDPVDLRGLGRRDRPDDRRRLHPAPRSPQPARRGPIAPRTKAHILTASRAFFRDCQEWEWIGRRFDPTRALAVPRSVAALIGTDPRIIADDVWAKLIWAGLQLQAEDLPGTSAGSYYPLPLIRALALTWLFSGLRSDEISRLRVGCIRWQQDGHPIAGDSTDVLAQDAVCLLDVPVHKTGTAFTKPVDPVGQAIEAWQALRPDQPTRPDRKTGEQVDLLFSIRAHPVAKHYINRSLIPALCAKAGVPTADVRGNITSHRARSTIASQLYNAKEPMTLFELQAWLGHRTPSSTQHYAKINPNTLSKAYSEAGYFARNIRTIEVLIDRDAVAAGAPATASPGSTTTSGTAGAATASSSSASTGWPAPAATSTPQGLHQGPAARSQGQPAADARRHPAHRRRTRSRRRRTHRRGSPPGPTHRHPHARRTHPAADRRPADRDTPAHRAGHAAQHQDGG